jgi:hypothetical protein
MLCFVMQLMLNRELVREYYASNPYSSDILNCKCVDGYNFSYIW